MPLNSAHRIASNLSSGTRLYSDRDGELWDYYVVTAVNSHGESASSPGQATGGGGISMLGQGGEQRTMGETITIRRTTYRIAGQPVAVRRQIVGGNNNVVHLHYDHLSSNSVMSYSANRNEVPCSRARCLPYGGWRTTPTQPFTERGRPQQHIS